MFINISQIKKGKAAAAIFALLSMTIFVVNVQTVQAATVEVIEKTAVPQVKQSEPIAASDNYFSTYIQRDRGSELPSVSSSTATADRCPAFVKWEDWSGSRWHAYVDFRPSDLCNGKHVKRAYVRLIRECGPYYDTGRIYTYTASSTTDTRLYSVSAWIFDSIVWSCNTSTYYGYEYF